MNKAKNLKSIFFTTARGAGRFVCQRAYGVVSECGKFALSADGVTPSTWHTMKTAKEIAAYCDGFTGYGWVRIFGSAELAA